MPDSNLAAASPNPAGAGQGWLLRPLKRLWKTRGRIQPYTRPVFLTLLCLALGLTGCARTPGASPTPLPTPKDPRLGEFIFQEDSQYGYSMLRPAGWKSADEGAARVYFPNPQDDRLRLSLSVVNLNTGQSRLKGGAVDVRWSLYRQNPDLERWADALVQTLYPRDVVRLERALDRARVYSVRSIKFNDHIQLVACVVDQSAPLEAILNAGGQPEDKLLEELERIGLVDDFITMVESIQAAP